MSNFAIINRTNNKNKMLKISKSKKFQNNIIKEKRIPHCEYKIFSSLSREKMEINGKSMKVKRDTHFTFKLYKTRQL